MTANAGAPGVTVRLARTEGEREIIYRLRSDAYLTEIPGFSAIADHLTRQLTDEQDEQSQLPGAYAGEQPGGTMRLTFGADAPLSAKFADIYGMDEFFPVVPAEVMLADTTHPAQLAAFGPPSIASQPTDLAVDVMPGIGHPASAPTAGPGRVPRHPTPARLHIRRSNRRRPTLTAPVRQVPALVPSRSLQIGSWGTRLSQVAKAVLKRALAEEMTGHLGYGPCG